MCLFLDIFFRCEIIHHGSLRTNITGSVDTLPNEQAIAGMSTNISTFLYTNTSTVRDFHNRTVGSEMPALSNTSQDKTFNAIKPSRAQLSAATVC
jgi:hypothetical protein